MNRKQFLMLLAVVVVVGAAGLWVHQRGNDSWRGGGPDLGRSLLPNLPVNDITQITIKSGTNELDLARRDNLWRVCQRDDYPANFSQISALLIKIDGLKIVQSEDLGPSQLGRLELLPPGAGPDTGTAIEFKDQGGKTLGSLLLGKKHMKKPSGAAPGGMDDESWPDGRYVIVGASHGTVAVISDALEEVDTQPVPWLNKDFVNIGKPRLIAVAFPEATNSWQLTRASETNEWQLADARAGEKLDPAKISSLTSPFSSINFNDVAARSAGGTASNTVLTVETFDGFTYVSQIGPKQDDNYPVSFSITANGSAGHAPPADKVAREEAFTNWVYQLPAYSVDEMLKTRSQLLVDAGTNSAAEPEK